MNQQQLIEAWKVGKKAKASALSTDGVHIYSYLLLIGKTQKNGKRVVFDYRRQVSDTTSRHVGLALRVADVVKPPPKKKPPPKTGSIRS